MDNPFYYFVAFIIIVFMGVYLSEEEIKTKPEQIITVCNSMTNNTINKVKHNHKYKQQVFDNFEKEFRNECLRLLGMRQ